MQHQMVVIAHQAKSQRNDTHKRLTIGVILKNRLLPISTRRDVIPLREIRYAKVWSWGHANGGYGKRQGLTLLPSFLFCDPALSPESRQQMAAMLTDIDLFSFSELWYLRKRQVNHGG